MNIDFRFPGKRAIDQHNRAAKSLADSTQRLGSGNRINSAGDDPAGLAVSEKLRSLDRGLRQGVRNISDGINYIDTVDGAMGEIHTMLDRLKEIAVEAANGPYSDMDRSALDLEYGQLLSEIDNISDSAEYNGISLFEPHKPVYSSFVGNVSHKKPIEIDETNSEIVVNYTMDGKEKEVTVHLRHGIYSAEECADMMDDVFYGQDMGIIIGLNEYKHFTMELEGGHVNSISGCGASLFYDMTIGSANGFLVGVTNFGKDGKLNIVQGVNDTITFHIGNPKKNEPDPEYSITLDPGVGLTRDKVIKNINDKINADPNLAGRVSAVEYKNEKKDNVIALASQQVVTGLKGNFILIDGTSSPIYDISKHSDLKNTGAVFDGKKDVNGVEIVRGRNDWFDLKVSYYVGDDQSEQKTLRINMLDTGENVRVYNSAADVVKRIQDQLDAEGIPITVSEKNGTIDINSDQFGRYCSISVDKTKVPSGYMLFDLFDKGTLIPKTPDPPDSYYQAAYCQGKHDITANGAKLPECTLHYTITYTNGAHDDIYFTLPKDSYSPQKLASTLNTKLDTDYPQLKDKLEFVIGPGLMLTASGEGGKQVKSIDVDKNCTAYRKLIKCTNYVDSSIPKEGETKDAKVYKPTTETGGPVVSAVPGSATGGTVTYSPGYSKSNPLSEDNKYFSYKNVSASQASGTSVEGELEGGTPTVMTLPDVLTQFPNNKSVEDLTLSFSFMGKTFNWSSDKKFNKGTSIDQLISRMNNDLAGYASVKRDGDSIVLTSTMPGNQQFSGVSGTLMRSATPSEASQKPGAVCDIENNKVIVPPSLELTAVSSHLPVEFNKDPNDNSQLIIYSGDEALYELDLTGSHDNAKSIVDEINRQIKNEAKGGEIQITAYATDDGKLVLTGTADMKNNISIGGTTQLDTRKTVHTGSSCPASLTIKSISSHFPLKVLKDVNDKVTIKYNTPTGSYDLELTIPENSNGYLNYNFPGVFEAQLRNALTAKGLDPGELSVSLTSQGLVIRGPARDGYSFDKNIGGNMKLDQRLEDNTKLDYVTVTGNTATTPGELRNPYFSSLFSGDGLDITEDNKTVALIVDGNPVSFELPEGLHTSSGAILQTLRDNLGADRVVVKNGTLVILSGQKGNGSKVTIDTSKNKAPIFSRPVPEASPQKADMYSYNCRLLGNVSINGLEIGDYNNKMSFDLKYKGNSMTVNVEVPALPAGDKYDANGLRDAIQQSINDQVGAGVLNVSVEGSNQLKIEGAQITNDCEIGNFKGRLFDMAFQDPRYTYTFGSIHTNKDGTTAGDHMSFIIGRNPMEPTTDNEIENDMDFQIFDGVNDELIFEFSNLGEDGNNKLVRIKLDQGMFTREQVAEQIERKTREALKNFEITDGIPIDVTRFRATIGAEGLDLSTAGSNLSVDDIEKVLVLSFRDYRDGSIPNTHVTIEGVRGTAAYRVFYKATKFPEPTRIYGASDLSGGLAIFKDMNDELTFSLDGEPVTIKIREGFYTVDTICDELDRRFEEIGSVVRAFNVDGKLMFRTTEDGDFVIDKFRGSAANLLFYGGELKNEHTAIGIQYGRRTDSYVWCNKACVSTRLLRLNTTGVTTQERALKALNRIDGAINYLSGQRAVTGAYENRLDRTRERNTIIIENIENSDSAIRDTDMALEQIKYIKEQIAMQAQEFLIPREQEVANNIVTTILDSLA